MQAKFTSEQLFWISQPAGKILSSKLFLSTIVSYWQHNYSLLKRPKTITHHISFIQGTASPYVKCEYVAFRAITGRGWRRWPGVYSICSVVKYFFSLVKGWFRQGINYTFVSLCGIGITHCVPLYHGDIDTC